MPLMLSWQSNAFFTATPSSEQWNDPDHYGAAQLLAA
jgi:hypothetical protein